MIHVTPVPPIRQRLRPLALIAAIPAVALAMALSSCDKPTPKPAPPPVTDTKPVGDGLKVIGFAMLGAAVVAVLGRVLG